MKMKLLLFTFFCVALVSCKKEEPVASSMKYMEMLGVWDIEETTTVVINGEGMDTKRELSITFGNFNEGSLDGNEFLWAIQCNPDIFLMSTELSSTGGGSLQLFTTSRFAVSKFNANEISMVKENMRLIDGVNRQVITTWKLTR